MGKTIKQLKKFHDKEWWLLEESYEQDGISQEEIERLKDAYYEAAIIHLRQIKKGRQ